MNPIVSIIIPIYNVEQYVRQCMESVIGQTIDHSLLECIVVNDCTPDRSMDIVNEVVGKYKSEGGVMSITVLNHEQNRGLSASRNTGMKEATGEFVYFVDSDDYLYPDSLKILMSYHQREPEADVIIGNFYDESQDRHCYRFAKAKTIRDMNNLYIGNTKKTTVWNSLIRHSILVENNIEFVEGIYFEDNLFSFQIYPLMKKVVIAPEETYFYRKNPEGIMLTIRKEKIAKTIKDYLFIFAYFINHLSGVVYVGRSIATIDIGLILLDYIIQNEQRVEHVDNIKHQCRLLSKKILFIHFKNGRIFMFLLSLFLYPLNELIRYKWFRHNYGRIATIYFYVAICWDRILFFFNNRYKRLLNI